MDTSHLSILMKTLTNRREEKGEKGDDDRKQKEENREEIREENREEEGVDWRVQGEEEPALPSSAARGSVRSAGVGGEPPRKKLRREVSPSRYFEIIQEKKDSDDPTRYGCSRCGNDYNWRKSLNKHWKEKHDGDPGDRTSDRPPGMEILLQRGKHSYTEPRKCVSSEFLKRITIKKDSASPALAAAPAPSKDRVTASALFAAARQNHEGCPGEARGNEARSPVSAPGVSWSAVRTHSPPRLGHDNPHSFLHSLNRPFVAGKASSSQMADETDGVFAPATPATAKPSGGTAGQTLDLPTPSTSPPSADDRDASTPERVAKQRDIDDLNDLEEALLKEGADRGLFQCPLCDKALTSPVKYSQHLATHPRTPRGLAKCAACRLHFPDMAALNVHFGRQHYALLLACKESFQNHPPGKGHQQSPAVVKPCAPLGMPIQCPQCPFVAKGQADLDKHGVSHSDERPFDCLVCGSAYKRKADLSKHFQNSHKPLQNPYQRAGTPVQPWPSRNNGSKSRPCRDGLQSEGGGGLRSHDTLTDQEEFVSRDEDHGGTSETGPRLGDSRPDIQAPNSVPNFLEYEGDETHASDGSPRDGDGGTGAAADGSGHSPLRGPRQASSGDARDGSGHSPLRGPRQASSGDARDGSTEPTASTGAVPVSVYKCTECTFTSMSSSEVVKHMEEHRMKRFKCPQCSYLSKWKHDVTKHMKRCAPGKEVVDRQVRTDHPSGATLPTGRDCGSTVQTGRTSLSASPASPHPAPDTDGPAVSQSRASPASPHPAPDTGGPAISQSRASTASPLLDLPLDLTVSDRLYRCQHCVYATKSARNLRVHQGMCKYGDSDRKGFRCLFCSSKETSQEAFRNHLQTHHLTAQASKPAAPRKYRCRRCSFTVDSFSRYLDHRAVHKKNGYGGEHTVDEARLKHPRKPIKTHRCHTCGVGNLRIACFLDHQKQVHGKNKCKYCSVRWNVKEDYLDHLASHAQFNPEEWKEFFMDSAESAQDENNNKDSGEKEKDSVNNNSVNNNNDSGEKETGQTPDSAPRASSSSSPVSSPSSDPGCTQYQLPCQWCGRQFRNIVIVLEHCKEVHSDQLLTLMVRECREEEHARNQREGTGLMETASEDETEDDVRSDPPNATPTTTPTITATRSWIHPKTMYTFKGSPLLQWTDDGGRQRYRCALCMFTHADPATILSHMAKVRHASCPLPKKYQCDYCPNESDVIHEVLSHLKKAHPGLEPGVSVITWQEISPPVGQQADDEDTQ